MRPNQFNAQTSPINKNAFLQSLKAQNWVLYYGLLSRHIKELVPIVYTPTAVRHYLGLSAGETSLTRFPGRRYRKLLSFIQAERRTLLDLHEYGHDGGGLP